MTKESVQNIIGKAVTESAFRQRLFADPDATLAGYQLYDDEIAALRAIDFEFIESFADALNQRISRAFMFGVQSGLAQSHAGRMPAATDASRIAAADSAAEVARHTCIDDVAPSAADAPNSTLKAAASATTGAAANAVRLVTAKAGART